MDLYEEEQKRRGSAIIDQKDYRADSYTNFLTKYGTKQDSSTAYHYVNDEFTDDMELMRLYESNGLFAKIIDRPAREATKHGLDIDFGDEQINEYADGEFDRLGVEDKFAWAESMTRLYGGAIIVMLIDDGGDLEDPVNWQDARGIEELRVFERAVVEPDYSAMSYWHFKDTLHTGGYGEPEYYNVFSIYGYFRVHKSRCLVFRNGRVSEHTTNANYRYWGIPEYIRIKTALRECILSHHDGMLLLERSSQAVYKMKNLANMMATESGEDIAVRRMQVIDMARSILNSIAIDSDGEEYDFKSVTMTGVKDVIDSTCNMLSAVTDIPQTILFGRSPAGENSTGEADFENYYGLVESIQKQNMKGNFRTLIDLILRGGKFYGKIKEIPSYKVKFAALHTLSDTDKAALDAQKASAKQTMANTYAVYIANGVMDPSEVRAMLMKDEEFQIEDPETPEVLPEELAMAEALEGTDINTDEDDLTHAAAVLIVRDGKILTGTRGDNEQICGPGGHLLKGEEPEQAAVRETVEEFNVQPKRLRYLGKYVPDGEDSSVVTDIYLSDGCYGEPMTDGSEMFDAKWRTPEELKQESGDLFEPFAESLKLLRLEGTDSG